MGEECAVCKKGKGPEKCEVCGFSDEGVINREFPIPEDLSHWLEMVVKPHRVQWEAKKRKAELLAQIQIMMIQREQGLVTQFQQHMHKMHLKHQAQFDELKAQIDKLHESVAKLHAQPEAATARQTSPAPRPPLGFVYVEGGTFLMGSSAGVPDSCDNEKPVHSVTVGGFYMGKYLVTQREWHECMGNSPSHFKGDKRPVETVNWYDAVAYANRKSLLDGAYLIFCVNALVPSERHPFLSKLNGKLV